MTDHPITPPPELVEQWRSEPEYGTPGRVTLHTISEPRLFQLLTRATQWGADQELEACCEWLADETPTNYINALRAIRRPKPPSLKEQALEDLESLVSDLANHGMGFKATNIRRALEALPDD